MSSVPLVRNPSCYVSPPEASDSVDIWHRRKPGSFVCRSPLDGIHAAEDIPAFWPCFPLARGNERNHQSPAHPDGVVAFYWLVDFLREMNWFGSLFSFSLLWATLSTVVFWETQQSESFVSPPGLPLKTRGLIISLSGLAPPVKADVDKRIQSIRDAGIGPEELRRKLGAAISLKVAGKTDRDELNTLLDPKGDSSGKVILDLLEPLLKIPLYTPLAAIGHHFERLEKTWVLRTARAKQEAWETFEQLISLFFPEKQPEPVDVRDPNNVAEVSSTVNAIYGDAQRAGIPEGDVTADITGGTASMSAGIILACVRSKRRVQYLRQDNFTLQPVDVTVRTIPWLVEEFIEQLELIRQ